MTFEQRMNCVQELLTVWKDIHALPNNYQFELYQNVAALSNNYNNCESLKILLKKGVHVNAQDSSEKSFINVFIKW